MKRVAALDFGTNTFLLLIADVENGEIVKVLHDEARVVRLGQGVHENRRFHPEALKRAELCLRDFSEIIRTLKAESVLACATSAARDVSNAGELKEITDRFGIPLQVISGNREAELTFHGTIGGTVADPIAIVDVGGGSTEFIIGDANGLKRRQSIDVGSVRLTEKFVTSDPIQPRELAEMNSYIQNKMVEAKSLLQTVRFERVIAVAGTPTTLAAIDMGLPFESDRVDGYVLTLDKVRHWAETLASMKVEERRELAGMEPKRADVIVAGVLILFAGAQALGAKELIVSVRGLRYGIARTLGGLAK